MANDSPPSDPVLETPSVRGAIGSGEVPSLATPPVRTRTSGATQNCAGSGSGPGRRRWIRRFMASACLLLTAAVIGALPVYVRPQIDRVRHADAIFILGGYGDRRYSFGLELGMQGWAPNVVVSNPRGKDDQWLTHYCATRHTAFEFDCFSPDPPTTKGEGRELHRLASLYGWRTVIVVTFRPHISRARFILEHCFDGDLVMVASPDRLSARDWVSEYVYQTAGYARAVLQPGC
jgi:uncharacterized SAM-binding protein YcdF (DUF218 family)